MSDEERQQLDLTPGAEAYQTPEWITRLAAERRAVTEQLELLDAGHTRLAG